jgi:carbon monoxide dehydrogenase subunit G
MNNKVRKVILAVLIALLPGLMRAGAIADSATVKTKKDTLISFDGCLKVKMETSTSNGNLRFSVRNSRVGVRGLFQDFLGYRLQLELNNRGQVTLLDVFGSIRSGGFTAILGQTIIPFENNYILSPSEMMFANRPFTSEYLSTGPRD